MPGWRSRIGTVLNVLFTNGVAARYRSPMVSLALAAAIAAAQSWQPQSGVTAQATATVRIVAGERVRFGDFKSDGERSLPEPTKTMIQVDGAEVPALLVEFS